MTDLELWRALNRIEDAGASVIVSDGALKLSGDITKVPADARAALRANRERVLAYLSSVPSPTAWVAFVSARLDCREYPAPVVDGVEAYWEGDTPFYRLDPVILQTLRYLIDSASQAGKLAGEDLAKAVCVHGKLADWVRMYFPLHRIQAAIDKCRGKALKLPKVERPPE